MFERRTIPGPAAGHRFGTALHELVTELSTEFINLPANQIDRAITEALGRVGEFANVDRAYVFLIDGERMANTNEWCRAGTTSEMANLQDVPLVEYQWCMSHILNRLVLHIPRTVDLPDDQPDKALLLREDIQSLLAVPIMSQSQVIGFVGFDAVRVERAWSDETVALLKIVGCIFGNAIERTKADDVLRKEKEFFAAVIETAPSLVLVLAPDGRLLRMNRAFAEITGFAEQELSDKGWQRVIPPESRDHARAALRSALAGERVRFEGRLISKSGDDHLVLWNGAVIRTLDGRPEYVVITGADLTETRRLREQLEQSRRLDSLGRVAATIAHEFNNVLMTIQPSADVIQRYPDRHTDVQRAAERIQMAVKRGERITLEVTRFTRPAEPTLQPIAAYDWMRGLVDEMESVLVRRARRPLELQLLPPGTSASVAADAEQLHQVFSNLLNNAADAIPDGGRITVSVDDTAPPSLPLDRDNLDSWVHFQVRDTGTGIAPAVLDRIFEPLFTTKQKGTGLGLAVAHQIIKVHGGLMSVETALGQGTTFHVFLRALPTER